MKQVCVVGLGYVGLPTASILATRGYDVLGVDTDAGVVERVNGGAIPLEEPGLRTLVSTAVASGTLRAKQEVRPADVFFISVPTPLHDDKSADLGHVRQAIQSIAPHLRAGNLVILESTVPPGTCEAVVKPLLEHSGLQVGVDLHLAYCPERVLPGNLLQELIENDRVVGGFTPNCAARAQEIYRSFVTGAISLSDLTTAEMVKVVENSYRDVNIALANETAVLCERLHLDFNLVARLANRHPRVNLHAAGPGVGGHCVPVDPCFLIAQFPEDTTLLRHARQRNDAMPHHVVEKIAQVVADTPHPKIGVLGLAYKGGVDDVRESPAVKVVTLLETIGMNVVVNDPHVKQGFPTLTEIDGCFEGADCVVVLTDHRDYTEIEPRRVRPRMRQPVIIDTRNILNHEQWRAAAFHVHVLGCCPT